MSESRASSAYYEIKPEQSNQNIQRWSPGILPWYLYIVQGRPGYLFRSLTVSLFWLEIMRESVKPCWRGAGPWEVLAWPTSLATASIRSCLGSLHPRTVGVKSRRTHPPPLQHPNSGTQHPPSLPRSHSEEAGAGLTSLWMAFPPSIDYCL